MSVVIDNVLHESERVDRYLVIFSLLPTLGYRAPPKVLIEPLVPVGEEKKGGSVCVGGGRDESERQRAESQWIVAARPLCHLQYPVAYLSRLQRILPAT